MLLNSFVKVNIKGKEIPEAYLVKRTHFRENSSIWLLREDKTLHVLPVTPIWSDRDSVVFKDDIPEGEQLIVSDLSIVIEGMDLRIAGDKEE